MRIDRNRRYRARPVQVGPSTVTKEVLPEDSCAIFFQGYNNDDGAELANAAYKQPDPFGIDSYGIPYSLNKKERWTIPERLREEIEELQDPHHNVRVSASTHEFDRADTELEKKMSKELRNRPALSYHTVSRDGKKVVNNYAKKGQARMQTLINPKGLKPWDFRKDQWKRKKQKEYWDENLEVKTYLPEEEDEDQKLHVMYSAVEMVAKPTTYNRMPREKKALKKRGTVARKHPDWALEPLPESDLDEEEEDEPTTPLAPPVAPSLASFLVAPPSKHAHPRHPRIKRESFKDESFRSSQLSLISGEMLIESSTEEEESEEAPSDVVIVESPSRIVLVTALPQLYTKIRLAESALDSLPALPVYPRAWEVHSNDTARVLGRAFPICILAKELADGEIGLFGQENCLSCADRWGRFGILLEGADADADKVTLPARQSASPATCIICCREMAADTVCKQARSFALACGHACCTGCWLQTISDGMKRGRVPAACPEPSCPLSLSIPAASALLDSASLRKYTDALTEALLKLQQIVRCRDCSRLHRIVSAKPSVRCVCGTSICARCSSIAHAPVSCKAFRDYCNYMQSNGLCSSHVSSADAPIVRNLYQCPKCGILAQSQYEQIAWCPNLTCLCGERFCGRCGKKWTDAHWNCEVEGMEKSVTMIDVSSTRDSDLHSTMLTLSIGARLSYFEKRKEVMDRLQSLSIKTRKEFDKTFTRLSHLMEICYLNSTKSKRSLVLAERIQFAMSYFFNTEDKNRRNLLRKTELLRKILNDISTELFGGVSGVQRKK